MKNSTKSTIMQYNLTNAHNIQLKLVTEKHPEKINYITKLLMFQFGSYINYSFTKKVNIL